MDGNSHRQTAREHHAATELTVIGLAVLLISVVISILSIYFCIAFCPGCRKKCSSSRRRRSELGMEPSLSFEGLDRIRSRSTSNIYVTTVSGSGNCSRNVNALALDNSIYSTIDEDGDGGFGSRSRATRSSESLWHTHYVYENLPGRSSAVDVLPNDPDPPPPYPGPNRSAQPLNAGRLLLDLQERPTPGSHQQQRQAADSMGPISEPRVPWPQRKERRRSPPSYSAPGVHFV